MVPASEEPEREGWVPGHLPRWPQETKPRDHRSKDAGARTSLLDTMLLFFTSFLKFLLILPLFKCLFFFSLFHCCIKYVLLIFFYKILELYSSLLFKVTPLCSVSSRSQESALLLCAQSTVYLPLLRCLRQGAGWGSVVAALSPPPVCILLI